MLLPRLSFSLGSVPKAAHRPALPKEKTTRLGTGSRLWVVVLKNHNLFSGGWGTQRSGREGEAREIIFPS